MAHILSLLSTRFTPCDLPGLTIWLDAQDASTFTFNGATISQWRDKSGKGNHATQATALAQPKYISSGINGYPALEGRHDGSNASRLAIADSATLDYTELHQFAVFRRTADLGGVEQIGGKYSPTGNLREHRLAINTSDLLTAYVSPDGLGTSVSVPSASGALATGTNYIGSAYFSAGITGVRKNKETVAIGTAAASVYNGSAAYDLFSRESALSDAFAGYLGEFLFFTRKLSPTEEAQILAYLGQKWGVNL